MIFLFDTTETFATPTFRGAKWEKIGRFLKNTQNRGIIPQIVLEETLNHIMEGFVDLRQKYIQIIGKLSQIGAGVGRVGGSHNYGGDEGGLAPYGPASEDSIRGRLDELGLRVEGYSECTLQSIVARALQRRKPFDREGQRGFRDAILWDTVKRVTRESTDEVCFITKNKADFMQDKKLDPQLSRELAEAGLAGRITVFEDLESFISAVVNPTLQRATEVVEQMRCGGYKLLDPIAFIQERRSVIQEIAVATVSRDRFFLQGRHGYDIVQMKLKHPLELLNVVSIDAYHTDDAMLAVTIQFEARAVLDAHVVLDLFEEGIPPYYEPTVATVLLSFTGSILVDEAAQSVVESSFSCVSASVTNEASPSIITSAHSPL